jgi:hypothetical protein
MKVAESALLVQDVGLSLPWTQKYSHLQADACGILAAF